MSTIRAATSKSCVYGFISPPHKSYQGDVSLRITYYVLCSRTSISTLAIPRRQPAGSLRMATRILSWLLLYCRDYVPAMGSRSEAFMHFVPATRQHCRDIARATSPANLARNSGCRQAPWQDTSCLMSHHRGQRYRGSRLLERNDSCFFEPRLRNES